MPEKSDEAIKKKHDEFNKRIKSVLGEMENKSALSNMFSSGIQKLRQIAGMGKR